MFMSISYKIRLLLIGCVLLVILLCLIQYQLVYNTYKLTREKYENDVRNEMTNVIHPWTDSINSRTMILLKNELQMYSNGKISRQQLIPHLLQKSKMRNQLDNRHLSEQLQNVALLKGVNYQMLYSQIIIMLDGETDTLLSESNEPLLLAGKRFDNGILLGKGFQMARDGSPLFTVYVEHAESIDISGWKKAVLLRMALVIGEASALIIALIILFYLILSALIRQRKMADIRTDFANNITHELKTPLSSLSIIIKSLEKKDMRDSPVVYDSLMASLNKQQVKLQHIVDNVLENSFSSPATLLTEVELNGFVRDWAASYPVVGHVLTVEVSRESRWLKTSPDKLETILNNLADNAVKYTARNSTIKVRAYTDDRVYIIEVADQGMGITSEQQALIFDKFYRVPENNLHQVKGLGLGLYLCKKASSEIGGTITVKSVVNEGSIFTIKLPLS